MLVKGRFLFCCVFACFVLLDVYYGLQWTSRRSDFWEFIVDFMRWSLFFSRAADDFCMSACVGTRREDVFWRSGFSSQGRQGYSTVPGTHPTTHFIVCCLRNTLYWMQRSLIPHENSCTRHTTCQFCDIGETWHPNLGSSRRLSLLHH